MTDEASPFALRSTRNRPRTALHRRRTCPSRGRPGEDAKASVHVRLQAVPEICQKLRYTTSRRHTTQPSAAPLTCAVMWAREVVRGVVNLPRIDGKWLMAGGHP
jgi:hypothetical protein